MNDQAGPGRDGEIIEFGKVLSESTRENIELQERYRLAVLEKIALETERRVPEKSSFKTFTESAFGRFVLGSVLLPLCVAGYSLYQSLEARAILEQKQNLEIKNYVERLDFEISYRYSKAMSRLQTLNGSKIPATAAGIKLALQPLTASADIKTNPPLYLEFNSLSGYALMAELRRNLLEWKFSGNPQPGTVGYAMTSLNGLEETLDDKPQSANEVAASLTDIMNRPARWAKGFHRTRCEPQHPFC
jgi:hypothetical protein